MLLKIQRTAVACVLALGALAASAEARPMIWVDTPRAGQTVDPSFHIGGWALDTAATHNAGLGVVHIWAYPATGAAPIFLGIAVEGGSRPDVAATFGPQFARAGFGMNTNRLPAGAYRVVLFPWSNITKGFVYDAVRVVPITVRSATAPRPPAPLPDPAPSPTNDTVLKVLDWNLHHGTDQNGACNIAVQAEWIARSGANVASLNEVEKNRGWCNNEDQVARLVSLLQSKTGKRWYHNFATLTGTATGQGNLLLTTFPIESSDDFLLSYGTSVARIAIIVNGIRVNVYSTHLDASSSTRRAAQMDELKRWADNYPEQRVVAGDFNAWPGAWEVGNMTSVFMDSWAEAARDGTAYSFSGNDGDTRNSRIDYIFFSKGASRLVLRKSQVLDTRNGSGVMASDHRPVVSTFDVR